jgi:hypothetical protein
VGSAISFQKLFADQLDLLATAEAANPRVEMCLRRAAQAVRDGRRDLAERQLHAAHDLACADVRHAEA